MDYKKNQELLFNLIKDKSVLKQDVFSNIILNFKGVKSFKINENILRSETAVISSISILSYILNL